MAVGTGVEKFVLEVVSVTKLDPNPWNPNRMDPEMYGKAVESIRQFGFVDPVTVRQIGERYEIIDGEHRWRAAIDLQFTTVPIINLGTVDDDVAKQLTIVLNETRGQPDRERLASLIRDLGQRKDALDLERVIPLRRQQIAEIIADRKAAFDWQKLERTERPEPKDHEERERWVELVYRMPLSSADIVNEAIDRVLDEGVESKWKALELICADYLAGT